MSAQQQLPHLLAEGPWSHEQVTFDWNPNEFLPSKEATDRADQAIAALKARNSPSHDGVATRLSKHTVTADGSLHLDLQATRWALRLIPGESAQSMTALCIVRDHEGRWLAGKRAEWVASWPGRWTLGAGGSVDAGESPMTTLERELQEEWSVTALSVTGHALVLLPGDTVMFVGVAQLAANQTVTPDDEHDEFEWWPADISQWPEHAELPVRLLAENFKSAR